MTILPVSVRDNLSTVFAENRWNRVSNQGGHLAQSTENALFFVIPLVFRVLMLFAEEISLCTERGAVDTSRKIHTMNALKNANFSLDSFPAIDTGYLVVVFLSFIYAFTCVWRG